MQEIVEYYFRNLDLFCSINVYNEKFTRVISIIYQRFLLMVCGVAQFGNNSFFLKIIKDTLDWWKTRWVMKLQAVIRFGIVLNP
jgi:hypothetical protein